MNSVNSLKQSTGAHRGNKVDNSQTPVCKQTDRFPAQKNDSMDSAPPFMPLTTR